MKWKEQAITIPVASEDLVLEGVWQVGGARGAVIAPPHPLYGGSLDHPVVNELAYALYCAGFASVRFNWRGVGASQGASSGDALVAGRDYRAALEQLAASVDGPLLAAGYSFGAAAALRVALGDQRVCSLILVAPPLAMIRELPLEKFERPLHVVVGQDDTFAPVAELSEIVAQLPSARLEVIPKTDHFFARGLAELSELVRTAVA